jgi:2-oxoisovalerate dehydrogenase E1 component alpha subunit
MTTAAVDRGNAELVRLYRAMVRCRAVDRLAAELGEDGSLALHVAGLGEEALAVGCGQVLSDEDWIFPSVRDAGVALVRGMPVERYLDNLFGNDRDVGRGRQLPDHISDRERRMASAGSLCATHLVHAVGFAWAAKIERRPMVVVACFGDSAVASGDFHNGMNFAGVFSAPVVFLCKNGGADSVADKAVAYGVSAARCDGHDLFAVIDTLAEARQRAADGGGATLVDATIVAPDDAGFSASDPVARLRRQLETRVGWSGEQQGELEASIATELDRALASARAVGPPPIDSMLEDVFAEAPVHLREQRESLGRS